MPTHTVVVPGPGKDWIALTLAVGICTALNLVTVAILYDALRSKGPGISENATQILTGWGGGIIGILGAVFGYRAGSQQAVDAIVPSDEAP